MLSEQDIKINAKDLEIPVEEVLVCCLEQEFDLNYRCLTKACELRYR